MAPIMYQQLSIAPPAGSASNPSITLSVESSGAVRIAIVAAPPSGKSVARYIIERSPNGSSGWSSVSTALRRMNSRTPARDTRTPTKWVHPSGTLDGNGAYTTIEAADAAAVPGDIIVVDGTYTSRAHISTSGSNTSSGRIYWRAFDYDNPPMIDGGGTAPSGWGYGGSDQYDAGISALLSVQAEFVTVDGFDVQDAKPGTHGIQVGECVNNGAFFFDSAPWYRGIEIYRCRVNSVSQGLIMWQCEDARFGGNDFSKCQDGTYWPNAAGNPVGWGSAVSMSGRNIWFCENKVRQTMGEAIHIGHHIAIVNDGGTPKGVNTDGFYIAGNKFYDSWSNPIYMTVGCDGIIEENEVFMSDDDRFWYARDTATGYPQYGIGVGGELGAFGNPTVVWDGQFAGVDNVKIRNNIINGANRLLFFVRYQDPHQTRNVEIDHNTIFCNQGAFASIYEALQNTQTAPNDMSDIKIRNNAVLVADSSDMSVTWNAIAGTGKVVQGNMFSHSPPADIASGTDVIDAAATVINDKGYSATSTGWPNEVVFDLTKAEPYLSGSTISPLVNAVAAVSGVTTDFYGLTRPTETGLVDIGAISLSQPLSHFYIDSGLAAGTYYYRARFIDSDTDSSANSDVRSITV